MQKVIRNLFFPTNISLVWIHIELSGPWKTTWGILLGFGLSKMRLNLQITCRGKAHELANAQGLFWRVQTISFVMWDNYPMKTSNQNCLAKEFFTLKHSKIIFMGHSTLHPLKQTGQILFCFALALSLIPEKNKTQGEQRFRCVSKMDTSSFKPICMGHPLILWWSHPIKHLYLTF